MGIGHGQRPHFGTIFRVRSWLAKRFLTKRILTNRLFDELVFDETDSDETVFCRNGFLPKRFFAETIFCRNGRLPKPKKTRFCRNGTQPEWWPVHSPTVAQAMQAQAINLENDFEHIANFGQACLIDLG